MGETIGQIPVASALARLTDLHEVENVTGPVSEKQTTQQIATLFQTALQSLTLASNNVSLQANGVVNVLVLNVGGIATIDNLGNALVSTLSLVSGNGAILASGAMTLGGISAPGSLTILDAVGGVLATINNDGSASFANGAVTIGPDGAGTFANVIKVKAEEPTIQLRDNSDNLIASLNGVDPSLNLLGQGALITFRGIRVGGTLKVNTTTTGNIGAGEDDLITFTVPANTLANDGEYLEFDCWGSFAATATAKDLKMYFDSVSLFDTTSIILNGKDWRAHGKIVRTAVDSFQSTVEFTVGGTLLSAVNGTVCKTTIATGADSLASTAAIFKCTGQDNGITPADNAVVQNAMVLKWYPAQ